MRLRPAAVLGVFVALAVSLLAVPAQAADPDPTASTDPPTTSTPAAAAALEAAEELGTTGSQGASEDAAQGDASQDDASLDSSQDATMVLRDLRMYRDELGTADRARAAAILQRPTLQHRTCYDTVCVHWSSSGSDRATQSYVDQVADVAQHVLTTYADAGYRAPESDGSSGGNGLLDIYLEDLGSQGLYGYCDSDDPPTSSGPYDAPAYCAFDNNYSEFPNHTPLENLEVTAAHELFHAVQFAYDYYEDGWFMEATATWAEDEVYDDVNDNVQYLSSSPLAQPAKAMDHFEKRGYRQYGDWIFFRWLTEQDPTAKGGLPTLVRAMWQRADGSAGGKDDYSIEAVSHVLAARGDSLRGKWARFAAANRHPARSYEEGKANSYPTAPLAGRFTLSGKHRSSGTVTRRVDHLAAATVRFTRAPKLTARSLKLTLDLPRTGRGSGAVVTTHHKSGTVTTSVVRLAGDGDATLRTAYGKGVTSVDVTLANAGTHYKRCWQGRAWSCQGRPQDDDLPFRVQAAAVR